MIVIQMSQANLSGTMLQREHQEAIVLQKLEDEEQARLDAIAKENRRRAKAKELEVKCHYVIFVYGFCHGEWYNRLSSQISVPQQNKEMKMPYRFACLSLTMS